VKLHYFWMCSVSSFNITDSMEESPLMKLIVIHLVKKFPTFYGTQRLNTVCTRTCHWSLSRARCIQSKASYPNTQRSIVILFYLLCLGLLNGLFPSDFITKIWYAILTHMCYMPHPCRLLKWWIFLPMLVLQKAISATRATCARVFNNSVISDWVSVVLYFLHIKICYCKVSTM